MSARKQAAREDLQQVPSWRYGWLVHAFTARRLGREDWFNLGYSATRDKESVTRNRLALRRRLGASRMQWVTLRQQHTDVIRVVDSPNPNGLRDPGGAWRLAGDAVVTDQPGLLLAVQVADCVPVLLVEPRRKIIAAVHAGWRGTVQRIVEKTVGVMQQRFGVEPARLRAALGPSIRRCCYEVGREVVEKFESQFAYRKKLIHRVDPSPHEVHWQQPAAAILNESGRPRRPRPAVTAPEATRYFLDLEAANRLQLEAAGVVPANIWSSPECTACHTDRLFSHRAEHGKTGRTMGLVGILPDKAQATESNRRNE